MHFLCRFFRQLDVGGRPSSWAATIPGHSFHEPKYIRTSFTPAFLRRGTCSMPRTLEAVQINRVFCEMRPSRIRPKSVLRLEARPLRPSASSSGTIRARRTRMVLARAKVFPVRRRAFADHSSTSRTSSSAMPACRRREHGFGVDQYVAARYDGERRRCRRRTSDVTGMPLATRRQTRHRAL